MRDYTIAFFTLSLIIMICMTALSRVPKVGDPNRFLTKEMIKYSDAV